MLSITVWQLQNWNFSSNHQLGSASTITWAGNVGPLVDRRGVGGFAQGRRVSKLYREPTLSIDGYLLS